MALGLMFQKIFWSLGVKDSRQDGPWAGPSLTYRWREKEEVRAEKG
jgi:hypothetical protein